MIQYQSDKIMQDKTKGKIVVEYDSNTFEFFDCSMEEAAAFMFNVWKDE